VKITCYKQKIRGTDEHFHLTQSFGEEEIDDKLVIGQENKNVEVYPGMKKSIFVQVEDMNTYKWIIKSQEDMRELTLTFSKNKLNWVYEIFH